MTNEQRRRIYARRVDVRVPDYFEVWGVDIRVTPRQRRRMKHKAGRQRARS